MVVKEMSYMQDLPLDIILYIGQWLDVQDVLNLRKLPALAFHSDELLSIALQRYETHRAIDTVRPAGSSLESRLEHYQRHRQNLLSKVGDNYGRLYVSETGTTIHPRLEGRYVIYRTRSRTEGIVIHNLVTGVTRAIQSSSCAVTITSDLLTWIALFPTKLCHLRLEDFECLPDSIEIEMSEVTKCSSFRSFDLHPGWWHGYIDGSHDHISMIAHNRSRFELLIANYEGFGDRAILPGTGKHSPPAGISIGLVVEESTLVFVLDQQDLSNKHLTFVRIGTNGEIEEEWTLPWPAAELKQSHNLRITSTGYPHLWQISGTYWTLEPTTVIVDIREHRLMPVSMESTVWKERAYVLTDNSIDVHEISWNDVVEVGDRIGSMVQSVKSRPHIDPTECALVNDSFLVHFNRDGDGVCWTGFSFDPSIRPEKAIERFSAHNDYHWLPHTKVERQASQDDGE